MGFTIGSKEKTPGKTCEKRRNNNNNRLIGPVIIFCNLFTIIKSHTLFIDVSNCSVNGSLGTDP
jgi:hypothetical protein